MGLPPYVAKTGMVIVMGPGLARSGPSSITMQMFGSIGPNICITIVIVPDQARPSLARPHYSNRAPFRYVHLPDLSCSSRKFCGGSPLWFDMHSPLVAVI